MRWTTPQRIRARVPKARPSRTPNVPGLPTTRSAVQRFVTALPSTACRRPTPRSAGWRRRRPAQTRRGHPRRRLGNYALFRCDIDDSQLVFGAARERNLRAQEQRLHDLDLQQHQLRRELEGLRSWPAS